MVYRYNHLAERCVGMRKCKICCLNLSAGNSGLIQSRDPVITRRGRENLLDDLGKRV